MNFYDYTGIIHLHSAYSFDGHATMEEILAAARKTGIDFLMLTDHDHLQARQEGWEGWKDKTLVIVGEEIAPRFNHYLAFAIQEPVSYAGDPQGNDPQRYIDAVSKQGGFGIIAHPDHEGTEMFHVKHYCWNDWKVSGYAAVGIWDFMTDWQKSLRGYGSGLLGFLFPAFLLKGPRRVTLERWDTLNQISKTVGIGELDNHASTKKILGIRFIAFPFERAFRFVRTHVLLEEPFCGDSRRDTDRLFQSLLFGRCYFALDYFSSSRGFLFTLGQNGQVFSMGDRLTLAADALLSVSCPAPAQIRIIRNGREFHLAYADSLSLPVEQTGVYRVEVFLKKFGKYRPWIFSNPIFVS